MLVHLSDFKYTWSWSLNKTADEIMEKYTVSPCVQEFPLALACTRHGREVRMHAFWLTGIFVSFSKDL